MLEVGTFTGYATLAMALAVGPDGHVTTLEADAERALVGQPFWAAAGVAGRITHHPGLALATLGELSVVRGPPFDLAYIDADKRHYPAYYAHALRLVRPGGLVVLDNLLWGGAVADPADDRPQAVALRQLATQVHADPAVAMVLLPLGDGTLLVRKR